MTELNSANGKILLVGMLITDFNTSSGMMKIRPALIADREPIILMLRIPFNAPHIMRNALLNEVKRKLQAFRVEVITLEWAELTHLRVDLLNYFSDIHRELSAAKDPGVLVRNTRMLHVFMNAGDLEDAEDRSAFSKIQAFELLERKAYSELEKLASEAANDAPDDFYWLLFLGAAQGFLHKKSQSEANLSKAVALFEEDPELVLRVGKEMLSFGNRELASLCLEKVSDDPLVGFNAQIGLARVAYSEGDDFAPLVSRLYEIDPERLRNTLREEWDFRLNTNELTPVPVEEGAEIAGIKKVNEFEAGILRQDIPGDFDPDYDRFTVYREEIEAWRQLCRLVPGLYSPAV